MHLVHAPHLGRDVVIGGCKLPPHHVMMRLPRLHGYMVATGAAALIPASPGAVAYNVDAAMQVITDAEGNEAWGDCVEAEEAHYIAVVTGAAGKVFVYTKAMVQKLYTALTGFDPAVPLTDQGTDPIACLDYCLKTPYEDGSVNRGYLLVDATNQAEVQYAIANFGNLKIWLAVPNAWISPFPSKHGFVWDVALPNPDNGHCIGSCGYVAAGDIPRELSVLGVTALGVVVMTWGLIGTITWAAFAKLCVPSAGGGCAVRVTSDFLNAAGVTPNGLNVSQLVTDFDAIGGTLPVPTPVPPAPPPGPPPPPPGSPITLANAQAWASAGINGGDPLQDRAQAIANANAGLAAGWGQPS